MIKVENSAQLPLLIKSLVKIYVSYGIFAMPEWNERGAKKVKK